jgi:hypothetical protein
MTPSDQTGWRQRIERALAELRDAPAIEMTLRRATGPQALDGSRSASASPAG